MELGDAVRQRRKRVDPVDGAMGRDMHEKYGFSWSEAKKFQVMARPLLI